MTQDPQDPQALLGAAEDLVRAATAEGADQAEVYWSRGVSLDAEIEENAVRSTGRDRSEGGGVRVVKDGRLGFAYFTDAARGPEAVRRALDLSRLSPRKDIHLPGPARLPDLEGRWDDDIAALDITAAMALVDGMLAPARDAGIQVAGGGASLEWGIEALANSEGVACADRQTHASAGANLVLADGERAVNVWDSDASHRGAPDTQAMTERLIDDLRSLRGPETATGGQADVVFRPQAVTELISGLVVGAVLGDDAMRKKTVWSDALGTAVADKRLSVLDDPLRNGALGGAPFDGDGRPARTLPIIREGELRTFLFDTRDAALHDEASTHSAVRSSFKAPPATGVHHLVVEGRGAKRDDALIADVDRGFLVDTVLGAHTANVTTGDFSVTAPNVWRIEDGAVVGPVSDIAIGGNLPALLQRLDGIGKVPKRMDGAMVPMLRFRDVHVSA